MIPGINLFIRYFIGQKIANGSLGQIRMATDIITGEELVVKLEDKNTKMPQLYMEYRNYKVVYGMNFS